MTAAVGATAGTSEPPKLSDDRKYVEFKGVKYEVIFKTADGKREIVSNEKTLSEIVQVLARFEITNLAETVLTDKAIKIEKKESVFSKDLAARVNMLFHDFRKIRTAEFREVPVNNAKFTDDNFNAGYPALANLGNTCYMDATLELLLSVKDILTKSIGKPLVKSLSRGDQQLRELLIQFFQHVEEKNMDKVRKVQEAIWRNLAKNHRFELNKQQDAAEFLEIVLGVIGYSLKGTSIANGFTKNKEKVWDRHTLEQNVMGVSIEGSETDFGKILERHAKSKCKVGKINNVDVTDFIQLHDYLVEGGHPPDVIFVQLGRWTDKTGKNNLPIDFLGKNNDGVFDLKSLFEFSKEKACLYGITGIVNHTGDVKNADGKIDPQGHYTAVVRCKEERSMLRCDDMSPDGYTRESKLTLEDRKQVYIIALKRIVPKVEEVK